jgi:hypothetical protein
MKGAHLGPAFPVDEIKRFLDGRKAPYRVVGRQELPGTVAALLASEKDGRPCPRGVPPAQGGTASL